MWWGIQRLQYPEAQLGASAHQRSARCCALRRMEWRTVLQEGQGALPWRWTSSTDSTCEPSCTGQAGLCQPTAVCRAEGLTPRSTQVAPFGKSVVRIPRTAPSMPEHRIVATSPSSHQNVFVDVRRAMRPRGTGLAPPQSAEWGHAWKSSCEKKIRAHLLVRPAAPMLCLAA